MPPWPDLVLDDGTRFEVSRATLRAPREKSEKARFWGVTLLPSRDGEAVVEEVA